MSRPHSMLITRQSRESMVMVSLEDFNAMQETLYLLSSPKNAERLARSIAQVKSDKVIPRQLLKMSKQKSRNKEAARSDTAFAFTDEAWEDYLHWQQADRKVLRNINDLLEDVVGIRFGAPVDPSRWSAISAASGRVDAGAAACAASVHHDTGLQRGFNRPASFIATRYMCQRADTVSVRGAPGMLYISAFPCAEMK